MGAHVSAVPNHQVGRITPLKTRGYVAMSGVFGYEMDLTKLTKEEEEIIKDQIEFYKKIWHIVFEGDLYRLISPFEESAASWMFVTPDKKEAFVVYVNILAFPNPPFLKLKLDGLDPNKIYKIEGTDREFYGDELMNIGINIPPMKDFESFAFILKSKE